MKQRKKILNRIRYKMVMLLIFLISSCSEDKPFNSHNWKKWNLKSISSPSRWEMVEDLISNYNLKGKTESEVILILGEPDEIKAKSGKYYYDLGPCDRGVDFGSLYVSFENKRASKIEKLCR